MPVPQPLLAAALGVSAVHAALPSHWLPFVLIGRSRRWTARRTLGVAALAGALHVGSTVLLGFAVAGGAHVLFERYGEWAERGAGAVLVGLGLWLATRGGHAHDHDHVHPVCPDDPAAVETPRGSDRAAVASLVGMLMISPCEAVLPLFFVAGGLEVAAILLVGGIVAASTVAVMLALVWATWTGLAHLHLHFLEEREGLANGLFLVLLGLAVLAGWA